jgi:hypothetical protein
MSNDQFTSETAFFGHTSEETAYLVPDYPYGFRLRTEIRYWIETTKNGDRFVSQTLNPKTGRWNKPKRSTYMHVAALYLNDEGHVAWTGVHPNSSKDWTEQFVAVVRPHLSDAQRAKLAEVYGYQRVMEHVTFSIHEGPFTPEDAAEQRRIEGQIVGAIDRETRGARAVLDGIA